jgi:hypothetical protein
VMIIAIVAAVIVPYALGRVRDQRAPPAPARQIRQSSLTVESLQPDGGRARVPVDESRVVVRLEAADFLRGLSVETRYQAHFRGRYVIPVEGVAGSTISVYFPFSPGMTDATNVAISVEQGGGDTIESGDVQYGLDGIRWLGSPGGPGPLTVVVTYRSTGRDAFVYDVAAQRRSGRVQVDLDVRAAPGARVASDSLPPTSVSSEAITWAHDRLIADRPIVIEVTALGSPLSQLVLLFRLAAVAVLLFGAGFWFLSEEAAPGALDAFRWGHFLLLAATYSLFFGVFAVVAHHLSVGWALGAASFTSLPLLALHVSRVIGPRFALLRALPLAGSTLGFVVGAVYLEPYRPVVLVGALVMGVAYVTLRFSAFQEGRREHARKLARHRQRIKLLAAARRFHTQLGETLERAADARRRGQDWLRRCPPGHEVRQAQVERLVGILGDPMDPPDLPEHSTNDAMHDATCLAYRGVAQDCQLAVTRWSRYIDELDEAVRSLEAEIGDGSERLRRGLASLADGLTEARITLSRAQELEADDVDGTDPSKAVIDGQHTLDAWIAKADTLRLMASRSEAVDAGDLRIRIQGLVERMRQAQLALADALSDSARRRERGRPSDPHGEHCAVCGAECGPDGRYCPACGGHRCHPLSCGRCGHVARLPGHLVRDDWRALVVHCYVCGQRYTASASDL